MNEMKEFILRNSNANSVIFYDESRVTRLIADFYLEFIVPVKEKKPDLKLLSTKLDEDWNENNPLVQMRLTLDYEESVKKSYRALNYQETLINKSKTPGKPERPGARLPFGYTKSNIDDIDDLVPDENAAIVKLIFYLYSFGYSERKIAELLESSKVPTPSKYSHWSDSSVRYILNNLWYMGNLVWFSRTSYSNSKKKPIEETSLFSNHHNPLIGSSLWETTQFFRNSKKNKDRMDSPFILRNLVFCNDCGEKLKTKNQTSAKSIKDESIYFCPNCKCKKRIDSLHHKVINDFSLRWTRELKSHKKVFKKVSNIWKKLCSEEIQTLIADIENLRYKMGLINPKNEHYDEFREAIELQLKSKEQNKLNYINVRSQIDLLLEDNMTSELIDRFHQDLHNYSNEEKKSIFLLSIRKINYDFNRDHLAIEYRLSPYVEIESLMDSITEQKTSQTVV